MMMTVGVVKNDQKLRDVIYERTICCCFEGEYEVGATVISKLYSCKKIRWKGSTLKENLNDSNQQIRDLFKWKIRFPLFANYFIFQIIFLNIVISFLNGFSPIKDQKIRRFCICQLL